MIILTQLQLIMFAQTNLCGQLNSDSRTEPIVECLQPLQDINDSVDEGNTHIKKWSRCIEDFFDIPTLSVVDILLSMDASKSA